MCGGVSVVEVGVAFALVAGLVAFDPADDLPGAVLVTSACGGVEVGIGHRGDGVAVDADETAAGEAAEVAHQVAAAPRYGGCLAARVTMRCEQIGAGGLPAAVEDPGVDLQAGVSKSCAGDHVVGRQRGWCGWEPVSPTWGCTKCPTFGRVVGEDPPLRCGERAAPSAPTERDPHDHPSLNQQSQRILGGLLRDAGCFGGLTDRESDGERRVVAGTSDQLVEHPQRRARHGGLRGGPCVRRRDRRLDGRFVAPVDGRGRFGGPHVADQPPDRPLPAVLGEPCHPRAPRDLIHRSEQVAG